MSTHVRSVADDPIVSKDYPANVECERTREQRMEERNQATTDK